MKKKKRKRNHILIAKLNCVEISAPIHFSHRFLFNLRHERRVWSSRITVASNELICDRPTRAFDALTFAGENAVRAFSAVSNHCCLRINRFIRTSKLQINSKIEQSPSYILPLYILWSLNATEYVREVFSSHSTSLRE